MNTKQISAASEIILVISMSLIFALVNAPTVEAAPVCCQKTTTNEYCQYVDESACAPDAAKAPTSCDATSFCKPGTCFDQNGEGNCLLNLPKSTCELGFQGKYTQDPTGTQTPECSLGCCVLGTQAFLSTEGKCRTSTAQYPDLGMDFRNDITTEQACTDVARSGEQGCCAQGPSACTYGAKSACTAPRGDKTGFFKDTYCSQVATCNCAPSNPVLPSGKGDPKSTMCVPNDDSVYWKDSCGNPEGKKETCDYAKGTLCGDSDKDGRSTCESLDCKSTPDKKLTIELAGFQGTTSALKSTIIRNGESYCIYDTKDQGVDDPKIKGTITTRSPVGSRYNRGLCINGKEIIEPCKDYRQEFCVAATVKSPSLKEDVTAARCIPNEWQSCITQCNTANPYTMDETAYTEALANDAQCCLDTARRDCSFLGNKCVPKVGPGFKFWEDEGAATCNQANVECPVVLACPGTTSLLGACDQTNAWGQIGASAVKIILGGALAAVITVASGGTAGAFIGPIVLSALDIGIKEAAKGNTKGWHVISGRECLSKDYLQAANNLCRSYGDCGANINYQGKLSVTGFTNTRTLPKEFQEGGMVQTPTIPGEKLRVLFKDESKVDANPGALDDKNDKPDWGKGKTFFDFTLKEHVEWQDRIGQRIGFLITIPIIATAGGVVLGIAAAPVGASAGVLAGSIISNAGPLGKILSFTLNALSPGGKAILEEFGAFYTRSGLEAILPKGAAVAPAAEAATAGGSLPLVPPGIEALPAPPNQLQFKLFDTPGRDALTRAFSEAQAPLSVAPAEAAVGAAPPAPSPPTVPVTPDKVVEAATGGSPASLWADALNTASWVDLTYEIIDLVGEQQKVERVRAECKAWVPPKVESKDQCERCNPDFKEYYDEKGNPKHINAFLSCTDYRCRSLGATCELVNSGSVDERCISTSKYDVSPPVIEAWKDGFDLKYKDAVEPLAGINGIKIKGEIPVYEKVLLALKTDQPAQCKMSFKSGVRYQEMEPFYFGTPTYKIQRQQFMFWPAQHANQTDGKIVLTKGGGDYKLYVRCENPKGVANEQDFVIQFTIGKEPDLTAPQILTTSLGKEAYLSAGTNKTDITLYTDEPAHCKWSISPQNYNDMSATNTCNVLTPNSFGEYECHYREGSSGSIGPALTVQTPRAGTSAFVYFKCQDLETKPNTMVEPFKITLRGSDHLNISTIGPSGEIFTSLALENITLTVATTGGVFLDGKALCKYTQRESAKESYQHMDDYFLVTNSSSHSQPLVLPTGDQTFYAGCVDLAGNQAYAQTSFHVLEDVHPPRILRAQRTDQPRTFTIVIDEDAQCAFSTNKPAFTYDEGNKMIKDGTTHSTTEDANTYYVRCKDNYANTNNPSIAITFL